MNTITRLEFEVVTKALSPLVPQEDEIAKILAELKVSDRRFSSDVTDASKCVGYYLYFEASESLKLLPTLPTLPTLPHHLGVHGLSHLSPAGGDFILFLDQTSRSLDYLEASFFGHPVSIQVLKSDQHTFKFENNKSGGLL
jgi:hypothetical protein